MDETEIDLGRLSLPELWELFETVQNEIKLREMQMSGEF